MPDTTQIDFVTRNEGLGRAEGSATTPVTLRSTADRHAISDLVSQEIARIGDYGPFAEVGRGGMGVVYKSVEPGHGHPVAIKVLNKELAAVPKSRRRFIREAKAAASVVHPHVVTIFDIGEFQGLPYYVMEFLAGGSLQARLRNQSSPAVPIRSVIRIAEQVALGLAAAHAQGILHRDIKPGNLLFLDDGDEIKLTDFGVFRVIEGDPALFSSTSGSTVDAPQVVGTPAYMSPEQVLGEHLTLRSDLFSLGVVIHAMVTGRSPFERPTLMELIEAVLQFDPPPLHVLSPTVPRELSDLVIDLLRKPSKDRVTSAAEVAQRLQRMQSEVAPKS